MFIFTEENIGNIKDSVYTKDGVKEKHAKKIESIKDGMFGTFNYSKYKVKNPPKNTSMQVYNELQYLKDLPEDDGYVEEHDDIEKVFEQVCKENNLEYPKELVERLLKSATGIILDLKYHHNRPRPYDLDSSLKAVKMKSMNTPSYPSGHSAQGMLIASALKDKYGKGSAFMQTAKNISDSRNVAHAHYKSDSKNGTELGKQLYKHTKKN